MKKNKILKTVIAIVLFASIGTSVIAASTGVVNVETVRVREAATTDSDIVELVSIGEKINIIGEEGNWYKVKVGKVTGYIRKDLLTVNGKTSIVTPSESNNDAGKDDPEQPTGNETTPTETPNETEEPDTTVETPGEEIPNETEPEVPSESDNRTTVIEQDTEISTIKIAGGVSAGKKVQLTKETKIKILPLANSSNIANLAANTEVTVLEVINSWCRIETGEYVGWVRIDQ